MSEGAVPSGRERVGEGASVVLVRDQAGGCSVLLRALSARGLPPVVVSDEPSVMVELSALADRGVGRRVLVVVEPTHWSRLDQLTAAVRAYHRGVFCWQFVAGGSGGATLSQLDPSSPEAAGHGGASGNGPLGKIRKRARTVDRLLVSAPGQELATREVVTQQELTMLLGPAPGEAG